MPTLAPALELAILADEQSEDAKPSKHRRKPARGSLGAAGFYRPGKRQLGKSPAALMVEPSGELFNHVPAPFIHPAKPPAIKRPNQ